MEQSEEQQAHMYFTFDHKYEGKVYTIEVEIIRTSKGKGIIGNYVSDESFCPVIPKKVIWREFELLRDVQEIKWYY